MGDLPAKEKRNSDNEPSRNLLPSRPLPVVAPSNVVSRSFFLSFFFFLFLHVLLINASNKYTVFDTALIVSHSVRQRSVFNTASVVVCHDDGDGGDDDDDDDRKQRFSIAFGIL